MKTTIGKLTKLSAVYILGDIVSRGAALLLLPIYMLYLSPAEYGIVGIAETTKQILIVLLSFGLTGAVARFYYQAADDDAWRRRFGVMWAFLVVVGGAGALLLDRIGGRLFESLFRQVPYEPYIRQIIWVAFLQSAFVQLPLSLLRAREQATAYSAYNLLIFGVTTAFTVGHVIVGQGGAAGYVRAQLAASLLLAALSAGWMLRQARLNVSLALLRPLLIYSLPLVPHFAAHWALNFADRVVLERNVSLEQIGIYALVYQFGIVMQMIVTAGNNALLPLFSRAANSPRDLAQLPRVITYYVLAIAVIVFGVAASAGPLILLLMPPAYHEASRIVVWIVVSYLAVALYYAPMNTLSQIVGKTIFIPLLTLTAAGVNVALNLLLVPRWGIQAAAVNTLVGFVVLLALVFGAAQRHHPLPYEYGRLGKIVLALGVCLVLANAVLLWQPLVNLLLVPLLALLIPLLLSLLGFWTAEERGYAAALWRSLVLRWQALRSS